MPAEYYLDTVKTVFQDYALPKGRMFVRGELVRPQAIREHGAAHHRGRARRHLGQRPDRGRARPVPQHPARAAQPFVAPGVGHYGIFSGRRWREMIFPRVRDFIQQALIAS